MPASFELDNQGKTEQAAGDDAKKKALEEMSKATDMGGAQAAGVKAQDAQTQINSAQANSQARMGGANRTDTQVSAGGIGGFFGAKDSAGQYTAQNVDTSATTAAGHAAIDSRVAGIDARPKQVMDAASSQAANLTQENQVRDRQMGLADTLQAQANGQGFSAAQQQLATGADRNMANALAMAAAGGGSPAAMRQAAFQRAAATQDLAGQSATLRAQETQAAQQALGGVLAGTRGQDLGVNQLTQQNNQFNAGQAQDANKTNLLSGVDQQKQKDDLTQKYVAMGMSLDQAQQQAQIQQNQFNAQILANQEAAKQGVSSQNAASAGQAGGAFMSTVGTMLASASDKNLKINIKDADAPTRAFLDSLSEKSWDYKNPERDGQGVHIGIIAQDAEKTPMGKTFVFDAPEGKHLDIRKATSAILASISNLNKRLKEVEG